MDSATELGLDWHVSSTEPIGGELKSRPEDFRVDEISDFNVHSEGREAVLRVKLVDRDTHRFASDLSNALGISRKRVSWAGTKDKKAVTTQIFTVSGADSQDVESVDLSGAEIEVLGRADHPIKIGDLIGNRFVIRIRGVENPEGIEEIQRELERYGGYPNLFDWQRFGSKRPITHRVGHHILKGDFLEAVDTYLFDAHPDEPSNTRKARRRLERERGYKEALSYYPRHLGYERALLNELASGASHQEALEALPRNLRTMFIHAVQSQVFNLVLRERHNSKASLTEAEIGDSVCFTDGDIEGTPVPDTDRTQKVTRDNIDTIQRHISRNRCYITAPLIGYETKNTGSSLYAITTEVLGELGLSQRIFERDDEYGSWGHIRAVLINPDIDIEQKEDSAVFRFALPKGCYATAVLREYLKDSR